MLAALVLHDRCFVFVPEGADSVLSLLLDKMREEDGDRAMQVSFEFRALEAIFATVARELHRRLELLDPAVTVLLDKLHRNASSTQLEKLRYLKNTVTSLAKKAESVQAAFSEVLDDDLEMSSMALSELHEHPEYLDDPQKLAAGHAPVEMLLECYLQEISSVVNACDYLMRSIETTERLVTLHLDLMRNRLLRLNAVFGIVTTATALATLITGIFGMNLDSGIQFAPNVFSAVAIACPIMIILIAAPTIGYVSASGFLRSAE
jgi:magnesium transporter